MSREFVRHSSLEMKLSPSESPAFYSRNSDHHNSLDTNNNHANEYLCTSDSQSSGNSSGNYQHSRFGSSQEQIPYPMMNLEEFIHHSSYADEPPSASHIKSLAHFASDFSPSDLALATSPDSAYHFNPATVQFNSDELKPQPIISKSRKTLVPDQMKDSRYWARRAKNNVAAKRSREARRLKENQIVLRASYLEKENQILRQTVDRLTRENEQLKRTGYPN